MHRVGPERLERSPRRVKAECAADYTTGPFCGSPRLRFMSVYMVVVSFVERRGVEPLAVGHRFTVGLREPLAITLQKRKKPPGFPWTA
jgi:hypothetical protein